MARRTQRPARITELAKTIWAIRKRKLCGQIDFGRLVGITSTQISRYESGHSIPDLKVLVRLLSLAGVPSERRAILRELRKQGIKQHVACLLASGLIPVPTPTLCVAQKQEAMSDPPVCSDNPQGAEK